MERIQTVFVKHVDTNQSFFSFDFSLFMLFVRIDHLRVENVFIDNNKWNPLEPNQ